MLIIFQRNKNMLLWIILIHQNFVFIGNFENMNDNFKASKLYINIIIINNYKIL